MNYLSLLFFQIFFYCYYGTLLIEEVVVKNGDHCLQFNYIFFAEQNLADGCLHEQVVRIQHSDKEDP